MPDRLGGHRDDRIYVMRIDNGYLKDVGDDTLEVTLRWNPPDRSYSSADRAREVITISNQK